MQIPFNKPALTGREEIYIRQCLHEFGKLSRDGEFTRRCRQFFRERYGFRDCVLTTSCTDALEMAAILLDIGGGDEVIMPAYTYVSTANAFALRGARIVFADSGRDNPNLDASRIEPLITPKTKAIVAMHYAGIACDMDPILALAAKHHLRVVEDAAHAIDAFYNGRPLGSIGHLGALSFHETKNVTCGEGGLLIINDESLIRRAEVVCRNGTNRAAFLRKEVEKYTWTDLGSSYLPSEITAAFLWAQLENLDRIQAQRMELWQAYDRRIRAANRDELLTAPRIPDFAAHNAHIYYVVCHPRGLRESLTAHLAANGIATVSHFLSLNASGWYRAHGTPTPTPQSDYYTDHLLRLPLYHHLSVHEADEIGRLITAFLNAT